MNELSSHLFFGETLMRPQDLPPPAPAYPIAVARWSPDGSVTAVKTELPAWLIVVGAVGVGIGIGVGIEAARRKEQLTARRHPSSYGSPRASRRSPDRRRRHR